MISSLVLTSLLARPVIQGQFIEDSMLGAISEAEKVFDKQFHLPSHFYFGGTANPGKSIGMVRTFGTDAAVVAYSGESDGSKVKVKVVDQKTKKVVDQTDGNGEAKGNIYFNPVKGHGYSITVTNAGKEMDYVSVLLLEGGNGPKYHVRDLRPVAKGFGAEVSKLASAGSLSLAPDARTVNLTIIGANKTTLIGPLGISTPGSSILFGGDKNVESVAASIVDKGGTPRERSQEEPGIRTFHWDNGLKGNWALRMSNRHSEPVVVGWVNGVQS